MNHSVMRALPIRNARWVSLSRSYHTTRISNFAAPKAEGADKQKKKGKEATSQDDRDIEMIETFIDTAESMKRFICHITELVSIKLIAHELEGRSSLPLRN